MKRLAIYAFLSTMGCAPLTWGMDETEVINFDEIAFEKMQNESKSDGIDFEKLFPQKSQTSRDLLLEINRWQDQQIRKQSIEIKSLRNELKLFQKQAKNDTTETQLDDTKKRTLRSNSMVIRKKGDLNQIMELLGPINTSETIESPKPEQTNIPKEYNSPKERSPELHDIIVSLSSNYTTLQNYLKKSENKQTISTWKECTRQLKELRSKGYVIESMHQGLKTTGEALQAAQENKAESYLYQSLAWLSSAFTPITVTAAFFKDKLWHDRTAQFTFGASSAWAAFSLYQAKQANNLRNKRMQTADHIKTCMKKLDDLD